MVSIATGMARQARAGHRTAPARHALIAYVVLPPLQRV